MISSLVRVSLIVFVSLVIAFIGRAQEPSALIQPIPGSVQRITSPEISWNAATNLLAYVPEQSVSDLGANAQSDTGGYIALWQPELSFTTDTITLDNANVEQLAVMQSSTQASGSLQMTLPHLLAFNPPGTLLVTKGRTGLVMYDVQERTPLFLLEQILGVVWSPDGTRLISQSLEVPYTAQIWDARTGNLLTSYLLFPTLSGPPFETLGFSWGTLDEVAISGISAGRIRSILNLSTGQVRDTLNCCPTRASQLLWQPNGRLLAMHNAIYDLDTQSVLFTFPSQGDFYWSPNGQFLVGTFLDRVSIISIAERGVIAEFTIAALGEGHVVSDVEWSPDLQYLALVTTDREPDNTVSYHLSLWRLEVTDVTETAD